MQVFYGAFAPRRLKRMISNLEPVKMWSFKLFHGVGFTSTASFMSIVGMIVVVGGALIYPQVQTLWHARDALCAGQLNFVFAVDRGTFTMLSPSVDVESMLSPQFHAKGGKASWGSTSASNSPPEFRPWHLEENDRRDLSGVGKVVDAVLSMHGKLCLCCFNK